MRKIFLLSFLCISCLSTLVGCRATSKAHRLPTDLLNQFALGNHKFESAPLVDVLEYVQSELNKQSDNSWIVEVNQDKDDIRSIGDDELRNWFKFNVTFEAKIGAGDFMEILTLNTFTDYTVDGNVITISRRIH